MSVLHRVTLILPADAGDDLAWFLTKHVRSGWQEEELGDGRVVYRIFLDDHPLLDSLVSRIRREFPLAETRVDEVENEDWSLAWQDFFHPVVTAEVFQVLPPWLAEAQDQGYHPIIIEPKMAFGTGHHPTTALCLETMGELHKKGRLTPGMRFLDVGTGSGILGIALCRLGMTGLGVDIDPQAAACARENIERNGAAGCFDLAIGGAEAVSSQARFDVVLANILSRPLMDLAPSLFRALAPGGMLLLSGILDEQAEDVIQAYVELGLPHPEVRTQGEWVAILWS
jgi:ribosomal protein L11 methyltransferase